MSLKVFACICLNCAAVMLTAAPAENVIIPGPAAKKLQFRLSDNGASTKAFLPKVGADSVVTVDFSDQSNADNYMFINFGSFDLTDYLPGGYLEAEVEVDRPILRLSTCVADPARFWPSRISLTGEALLKGGRQILRFYFDEMPEAVKNDPKYQLHMLLHDTGGESKGEAKFKLLGTKLVKSAPHWEKEKTECYRTQYNWRNFPDLGKFYRGKYDRLVPAAAIEGNPFVTSIPLNGEYEKKYIGDITWKYDQLLDYAPAKPGVKLDNAQKVKVPEPAAPDQPGGYYWYKRDFKVAKPADGKVYLQFKDLADTAEIFVNGERVGTQTNARRNYAWVMRNSSRQTNTWGKPAKEVMKFQHFERCGIKFPFDESAIPDDDVLLLPILTGKYPWNYVYDVTGLVKNDENTLAVRLYNNPVRGYWIFKNGEERHHKGIAGILGDVNLYVEQVAAFTAMEPVAAEQVGEDGMVIRTIAGTIRPAAAKVVADGHGLRAEAVPDKDGKFAIPVSLPANFDRYCFTVTALDQDGKAFAARNVEFNGSVIEFRHDKLFVNGDSFQIRGINGDPGIEWNNAITKTRRHWLNRLKFFKNLGFNAMRMEGITAEQIQDACEAGFMVMPVYASGSCNTSEVALGNLDNPDYEQLTDAHKEMVLQLNSYPNILFWNSGNENHPSGGYNDKPQMERYLEAARENIRKFDPGKRPVTYANLDTFGNYWFFNAGQDVLGYNSYALIPEFKQMMSTMYKTVKKPIVFCEWGFTENAGKGAKYRSGDIQKWENEMREKLGLMRQSPGVIGGFLYAHHGELDDVRGREFLQEIMASFKLTKENDSIKFENQDVATLRKVSIQLVSPDNVISSEWAGELKPGGLMRLAFPEKARKNSTELRLEISFETHRGLQHRYTRMVDRIK